jgi:hypothetical protein
MSIKIPNYPELWESGVDGQAPAIWFGNTVPDGDAKPFTLAPVGSLYFQNETTPTVWVKTTDAARDSDWSTSMGVLAQRVLISDFTDGGTTTGTLVLDGEIPIGAFVERVIVTDVTGFAGDTTAVLMVGDGTDDDRYNASADIDVFTTVAALDGGAPQGTQVHVAAKSVTLTITSTSDFAAVVTNGSGAMTVKIFYVR